MRTLVSCAAVAFVVVLLSAGGAAQATPTRDALVRPGVGIGELRLGMTLEETLRTLGRPVVFEVVRVFPEQRLRYLQYRTRDYSWRIAVFGVRGRERLARISSRVRRERTRGGVGVGTPVAKLPVALRAQRPVCVKRYPFFNYVLHEDLYVAACAVRTPGIDRSTTTVFDGEATCAVPVLRYQGCTSIRYRVGTVYMESDELTRYDLSWWYPVTVQPERPSTG